MKEFGKRYYKHTFYYNFDEENNLNSIFETNKDPKRIVEIQHELLEVYENDFSKHNGKINSGRLLMVFRSIASQLAKENEKFVYGALRKGGRAREFEEAIEWLVSAGLLKNMAGIDNAAILLKSDYQFKGPLTENYVLQQIKNQFDVAPRYYSNRYGEIDFIIQYGTDVIPVEAKGGIDKSAPTFKTYIKEHDASLAIRISERGYRRDGAITNFPPYLAGRIIDLI